MHKQDVTLNILTLLKEKVQVDGQVQMTGSGSVKGKCRWQGQGAWRARPIRLSWYFLNGTFGFLALALISKFGGWFLHKNHQKNQLGKNRQSPRELKAQLGLRNYHTVSLPPALYYIISYLAWTNSLVYTPPPLPLFPHFLSTTLSSASGMEAWL
jgi:hypothetical protein